MLTSAASGFAWNTVLSCTLTITVLVLVIHFVPAANWFLAAMIFWLFFGITWLNTTIEAVVFQVLPVRTALESVAAGVTTAFTVSILLCFVLRRLDSRDFLPATRGFARKVLWKLPFGAVFYFLLYLAAGIMIHPYIAAFYGNRWLPSVGELFIIQVVRGLIYISIALPFLHRMIGQRVRAAVLLGLCFSVLGGIAPLLLPNVYMPTPIRVAHSFEVGISNFLYGLLLAWLFGESGMTATARA
jgi:hypothetical protein